MARNANTLHMTELSSVLELKNIEILTVNFLSLAITGYACSGQSLVDSSIHAGVAIAVCFSCGGVMCRTTALGHH